MMDLLKTLWYDPALFNYCIMVMYLGAAARWAASGRYVDMCYWISAFGITATVTFGYKH
jgi:hypothetical protein